MRDLTGILLKVQRLTKGKRKEICIGFIWKDGSKWRALADKVEAPPSTLHDTIEEAIEALRS